MTMPETPNFKFKLIPDRFRGWGQIYRDMVTTVDAKLREALDNAASGGSAMAALTAHLNSGTAHALTSITGLVDALNGKSPLGHRHSQGEIDGLVDLLNSMNARLTAVEQSGGGTGPNPGAITADFTFTKGGADQRTITFDATATTTNGHAIVAYEWAFGDGATNTAQDPVYTYGGYGTYTISLLVRDSSGSQKTVQKQIEFPQTVYYPTNKASPSFTQGANGRFYYTAGAPVWQSNSGMASGMARVNGNTASGFAVRVPVPTSTTGLAIATATLHVTGAVGSIASMSTIDSVTGRLYRRAPTDVSVTPFTTLRDENDNAEGAPTQTGPTSISVAFDPAVQQAGYWEFWFDVDATLGSAQDMDFTNVHTTVTWA